MIKKIIILFISLLLISCSSPFGQAGIKFKNRKGIYRNTSKNITVTVTDTDKQNLIISVQNVNGINIDETYDINPAITAANFNNLKSEKYSQYSYVIIFNGNTSLSFSIREGTDYPINGQELVNSK